MSTPLYIGMGPPYVVRAIIAKSADFDPELAATATPIVFEVTKQTGGVAEWTATVITSDADAITIEHALAIEDLDERGTWTVWARFTLPGGAGELRTTVGKLGPILAKNQAQS